jgi:hypothetical protein
VRVVSGSTKLQRLAAAVRLTPSVRDNFAALAALAKTILDAIASRRGNDESVRFLCVTSSQKNDANCKAEKKGKGFGCDFQNTHLGAR